MNTSDQQSSPQEEPEALSEEAEAPAPQPATEAASEPRFRVRLMRAVRLRSARLAAHGEHEITAAGLAMIVQEYGEDIIDRADPITD